MGVPILSDNEMVTAILNRSRSGAEFLYDHYAQLLYRIILLHVQDAQIAQNLLEEVFVDIWNAIEQFDPAEITLKMWIAEKGRRAAKAVMTPIVAESFIPALAENFIALKLA